MTPGQKSLFLASLREFGSCDIQVHGRSMWPFIRPGDTVTVQAPLSRPAIGTVVAFFDGDRLVVHRVLWRRRIETNRWRVLVQGDTSPRSMGTVDSRDIAGAVVSVRRGGRDSRLWISGPARFLCIPLGWGAQLCVLVKILLSGTARQAGDCR